MRNPSSFLLALILVAAVSTIAVAEDIAVLGALGPEPEDSVQLVQDWPGVASLTPPPVVQPVALPAEGFISDVQAASLVFDGVLLEAVVRQPKDTRILVTDYVFQVIECLTGPKGLGEITLTSVGGELPDGSGMTVGESLRLEANHRFLVVTKPHHDDLMLPYARVLLVSADGLEVADEAGRVVKGLRDGFLTVDRSAAYRSLRYRPESPAGQSAETPNTPPDGWAPPPGSERAKDRFEKNPLSADALLDLLAVALAKGRGPSALGSIDTATLEDPTAIGKFWWCGWFLEPHNYYCYLPDEDNWNWWNDSAGNWNTIVDDNPSGPDWLIGYRTSGGVPIRDRAPVAGDGNNHTGVVSDAQLTAGGYGGTWTSWGANGINFTWYSGVNCTEIVEVDSFVNPVLANDADQFRKSMTHELGHALGLSTEQGHEDRMFALMYSGTWRQPPNYESIWYGRMDDMAGERELLAYANTQAANTWVLENWIDLAAWSQTHDNWGYPGNLIMTDASAYSGYRGDSVTISHIQVENRGNLPATNIYLYFYLSPNPLFSYIDHLMGTAWWETFPAHGRWSNGSWPITVPSGIPAGTYYIGWALTFVDGERATANNTAIMVNGAASNFSERTFTVYGQPDLRISSRSTSASSVPQGGSVTVYATAHNQGDGNASSTTLRYYLSTGSVISTADTQLATDYVPALAPDGSSPEQANVILSVTPGNYWLGACVDSVANEEFTNNQCSTGVPVQVIGGDLIFADGFETGTTSRWD